jgi:hypothetical protein
VVDVTQAVRDRDSALLAEVRVTHVYRLRDDLIACTAVRGAVSE